jgi:CBS domain containing-hemolysin-like protein
MTTGPKRGGKTPKNERSVTQLLKKILNFFLHLIFGKKSKKSFFSVISHVLEDYQKENLISVEEKKMFKNIASFGDKKVASIMTPRTDLIAIKHNATLEEIKKIITTDEHTRIPVFKNNLDEIIGFIHSKDLAKFLCNHQDDFSVDKIMRKILFVPGSSKLLDLMLRMRMARTHIAIVLDEFGGVDGLITIENLMEEIVGSIEDEHDLPSDNVFFRIKKINQHSFELGGRVEIEKVEELLNIKIKKENDEFETVSGLIMAMFKRIPEAGEELEKHSIKFKIIDANNRAIRLVEVTI